MNTVAAVIFYFRKDGVKNMKGARGRRLTDTRPGPSSVCTACMQPTQKAVLMTTARKILSVTWFLLAVNDAATL
jgi:hypothetical protein